MLGYQLSAGGSGTESAVLRKSLRAKRASIALRGRAGR